MTTGTESSCKTHQKMWQNSICLVLPNRFSEASEPAAEVRRLRRQGVYVAVSGKRAATISASKKCGNDAYTAEAWWTLRQGDLYLQERGDLLEEWGGTITASVTFAPAQRQKYGGQVLTVYCLLQIVGVFQNSLECSSEYDVPERSKIFKLAVAYDQTERASLIVISRKNDLFIGVLYLCSLSHSHASWAT